MFPYATLLGSTVDTRLASVYEAFGSIPRAPFFFYFRFKLIGKGRSEQWEVFLFCDKTIKMTVVARKCCPGVCLRLAFVVSASVLHPTWPRITPSMSCACLLSVAWE